MNLLVVLALLDSCQRESVKIDMRSPQKSISSQNFDSAKLAKKLVGSWKLTAHSSALSGAGMKANKDVKVTFITSGIFRVTENSSVVTEGTWQLRKVGNYALGLGMDNPSQYLYGRIVLCGDRLLFNNSYVDGCDNLFARAE